MSERKSTRTVNDNDRLIVDALRGVEGGLTLAQINEKTGADLKPAHITHAIGGGFIESCGEVEIEKVRTRPSALYTYAHSEPAMNKKGEPVEFSDMAKNILEVASKMDGEFSIADLAEALGVDKLANGYVTSLVKKGNLVKSENTRDVAYKAKSTNKVYCFVKDIDE